MSIQRRALVAIVSACAVLALGWVGFTLYRSYSMVKDAASPKDYDALIPDPGKRLERILELVPLVSSAFLRKAEHPHLFETGGIDPDTWFSVQLDMDAVPGLRSWLTATAQRGEAEDAPKSVPPEVAKWWHNGKTDVEVWLRGDVGAGAKLLFSTGTGKLYGVIYRM